MTVNKLLVICGPTAIGKTELAINLAQKFDGEVVSADSRQVYRYMNIGTGKGGSNFSVFNSFVKDKPASRGQFSNKNKLEIGYYEIKGVKIWLYDIVEPDYKFNVADYKGCADLVISDILKRKKLPVLVGGTGFYIKAVIDGIETLGIPPNWELREKLSDRSVASLINYLKRVDPEKLARMNESDKNNKRRLIRAIEIALESKNQGEKLKNIVQKLKINKLIIGLTAPYKILYQRVDKRVDERINAGLKEEIERLLNQGYNFENSALGTTIGYREWRPYFREESTFKEVIKKWKNDEHAYVRRQMTWFKKDKRIKWFDINKIGWQDEIEILVSEWVKG